MYLNFHCSTIYNSFPVGLVVKSPPANAGDMRPGSAPWVGKIPWRTAWQSSPVFLPGESHGQRSLAAYSPRGRKESDMTERLHFYVGKMGLPGGTLVKNSSAEQETGAIHRSGRSPGGGNGSPLSCLENSMDRGVW